MSKFTEVTLPQYPTNLINKDWTQRPVKYYADRLGFIKKVHELEVYDDDVWLVTLPKCGTTWMQELLWLIMNNFDFETAKREHLEVRTPFLEFDYIVHENLATAFGPLDKLIRPRLIKTHLCLPLVPAQIWYKKPKVIYVARNIKDAYVSQYYHTRSLGFNMDKTLDEFVEFNMQGGNLFDPFLHITEFYSLRNEPWLYYTSFECMKQNLRQVITDICKFLNKTITPELMEKMLKHLSFEEMKNNPKTNHIWEFEQVRKKMGLPYEHHNFVRKGQVNGYKKELSKEMVTKLDKWVLENLSKYNLTMEELFLVLEEHSFIYRRRYNCGQIRNIYKKTKDKQTKMYKLIEVKPQRYPTNLLNKDWSKRIIHHREDRLDFLQKVHELEIFDDDVWLVTLPKCGTTWMQELLWLVMNDFDFETALKTDLEFRSPFMEFEYIVNENLETAFKPLEQLSRPRLIKTHLCLPLLPAQIWDKKPKVIYVARNIRDAYVSEYYHTRSLGVSMDKTIDEYINAQMVGPTIQEPFSNLTEFYSLRNESWLYYTSFERMKLDLRQVITEVCNFLNKTITEETMERMLKHLSFEEMKNNPKTNHIWEFQQVRKKLGLPYEHHNFVRKGQVNGYKEELSAEMVDKLDKWVVENLNEYNVTMDELLLLK
ncbi:hypothetical protein FF38_12982 [Lucilia cuprina]|uniref:Sulfotransferase domain-containing protein n=1 Tax=Lucilia cuprina TaxID=7375 RepID=A0A0L0BZU1_LUCCU|nr:hypothetical protein FF38_12982 [Lucilia cuprina]